MKPPGSSEERPLNRLLSVMRRLRSPDGCPWDREQTLESLKPYLLEEAYEVIDAIDSGDRDALKEELGDLLLQIVFQAQICAEEGAFDFDAIPEILTEKLVRRHPHVFGETEVDDADEVIRNWDAIKRREKDEPSSTLGSVPRSFPALRRAQHIQQRAARVGFDWDTMDPVIAKIEEELEEVREALRQEDPDAVEEEIGDLLFAVVNLSRNAGRQAEDVLHGAIDKFARRFSSVEQHFHRQGRDLGNCTLDEMDAVWEAQKTS